MYRKSLRHEQLKIPMPTLTEAEIQPLKRVFDSSKLVDLMQKAERGETLC